VSKALPVHFLKTNYVGSEPLQLRAKNVGSLIYGNAIARNPAQALQIKGGYSHAVIYA
jgi:hypothetical protein